MLERIAETGAGRRVQSVGKFRDGRRHSNCRNIASSGGIGNARQEDFKEASGERDLHGLHFRTFVSYPRKFSVISGDKAQAQLAGVGDVPMNFAESGGSTIATVALPADSYPQTDFASAFFTVNINRSVSEQECGQFAFVDTRNADGEPVDAEKVKIGAADMETTSSFSASADAQAEAQYYHSYENGACYEYVLGLGTEGSATEDGVEHVDRDQVFARLEKILATVKIDSVKIDPVKTDSAKTINPVTPKPATESEATGMNGGKE